MFWLFGLLCVSLPVVLNFLVTCWSFNFNGVFMYLIQKGIAVNRSRNQPPRWISWHPSQELVAVLNVDGSCQGGLVGFGELLRPALQQRVAFWILWYSLLRRPPDHNHLYICHLVSATPFGLGWVGLGRVPCCWFSFFLFVFFVS